MHIVFQGETGGFVQFVADPNDVAVSGYIDVVRTGQNMVRYDGTFASGILRVPKSELAATLTPGLYVVLPQLVDAEGLIYFLDHEDLRIIEVPDFFNYAELTPASSLLARLNNLEGAALGYTEYTAKEAIGAGKLVAFDPITQQVELADSRNSLHIGNVIGFAVESASANTKVKVRTFGVYELPTALTFPFSGSAFVGYAGNVANTVLPNSVFTQRVGVVTSTKVIVIFIDSIYILSI